MLARRLEDGLSVGRLERLIVLRSLPVYDQLPPEDVAAIAERSVERRWKAGELLIREGEPVAAMHFIVRGEVELRKAGRRLRTFGPRSAVGGVAALAEDPTGYDCLALTDTVSLRIPTEDMWDVFEDHYSVLEGVLGAIARAILELRQRIRPDRGFASSDWTPRCGMPRSLDLIGRMAKLRHALPFAGARIDAIVDLARETRELRYDEPCVLWECGAPAQSWLSILYGTLRLTMEDGTSVRFGPGDTAGSLDCLGEVPRWFRADTEGPFVALALSRDAMFDVLEDHFEMAKALVQAMAQEQLRIMQLAAERDPA